MAKKEKKEQYMSSAMRTFRNQIVKIIPEQSPLFRIMCLTAFRITAKKKHKLREAMKINIPVKKMWKYPLALNGG